MKQTDESYKVPNLEKGLAILEFLSLNPRGKSLQDIKIAVDIAQTTLYRILSTLVRQEFVNFNSDTKRYTLSYKLLNLGFRTLNQEDILETVIPHMRQLRNELKETVCYGVLGDRKGIFIEQVQGTHTFSFVLTPGKAFDLHCSAPGKAMMAYLPKQIRNEYLEHMEFKRHNENTITSTADYLKELERVILSGYALDNEEELKGVVCIGAPVLNYSGYPCGAIWISGPKGRIDEEQLENFAAAVKATADGISSELGYYRTKK